jgi:hypothetical protein
MRRTKCDATQRSALQLKRGCCRFSGFTATPHPLRILNPQVGHSGRAPRTITATKDANRYLVSNISDYNKGLSTLVLTRDTDGKVTQADMTAIDLSQPTDKIYIDRLDIQRAQSAVLVTVDGVEYAIVSDDNYHSMDPYWKAMYEAPTFLWTPGGAPIAIGGSASAKKVAVGGKLGIVKDPFGNAQYLGATLPLDGYGIINLGVSEDGKVLIGQLKGGFSGNLGIANHAAAGAITPGWNIAFPSQSHAWNVADLIHAAVAMPEKDRMSKHINVKAYPNIEQLVKDNVGLVAGTFFDDGPVVVNVNDGRMGDVVEVDLKKLVTNSLSNSEPLLLLNQSGIETRSFSLAGGFNQDLYPTTNTAMGQKNIGFKLINANGTDSTAFESAFTDPYTRGGKDGELVSDAYKFKDTGRMYLVPNITPEEETILRNGGRVTDKHATVSFRFEVKNSAGVWEWRTGTVNVTAKDIPAVQTFFGDRPLDNPGYSAFTLHGEVSVAAQNNNTIDLLDVYRVEQRLKYLGFPAMGSDTKGVPTEANNTIQDFTVDGNWGRDESLAANLFGGVVNYSNNDHRLLANPTVTKTKTVNGVTTTVQAPRGVSAVPEANRSDYFNDLYGIANGFTINQAGTFSYSSSTNTPSSGTGQFLSYLSAYNAPHWMNVFESLQGVGGVTVTRNMQHYEAYGTSWLRDWLRAYNYADTGFQNSGILYNGTVDANHGSSPFGHGSHDLGMAFDLGLRGDIIGTVQNTPLDPLANARSIAITDSALPDPLVKWSAANAATLLALLPNLRDAANSAYPNGAPNNDQQSALKNFLALYDITQGARTTLAGQIKGGDTSTILNALFGDGTQATGLVDKVHIGSDTGRNSYQNIRDVLARLGITSTPVVAHQTHFHIYLRPPIALPLTQHLLADALGENNTGVPLVDTTATNANQAFDLSYTEDAQSGEATMLLSLLVPAVPPLVDVPVAPPAMVAQAATNKINMTLSACEGVKTPDDPQGQLGGTLDPAGWYQVYMQNKFGKHLPIDGAKVTLLVGPTHGKLENPRWYTPEHGFLGQDKVIHLVELGGKRIKVITTLYVDNYGLHCEGDAGDVKRISSTNTSDFTTDLAAWLTATQLSGQFANSGITLNFADLPAGALGQTTGSSITLDTNAAGNNWFIDTTPSDNSEYLPTSNPKEWIAKAGSAAAGKMDMLSVLLHEYGHALGIDHSADAHDYMGTTLTAGVRRLPTADEMALMQHLIAQAKNGLIAQQSTTTDLPSNVPAPFPTLPLGGMGIAFAGLLQRNRYGGLNAVLNNSTLTQYDVAANATLTNGNLSSGNGWATQGSVNIGNGVATLNEISTTQTRLSQVFMVNANDRYLSFTLSGTALDKPSTTLRTGLSGRNQIIPSKPSK